jgi:hypothetical protein
VEDCALNNKCITVLAVLAVCLIFVPLASSAQDKSGGKKIDFVNMGGDDCPPCVDWRKTELPKLQATPEFKLIRYTHVTKFIRSGVPGGFWFPAEVTHLQPVLKEASNGNTGSPHQALLVNGEVVDYWFGTSKGNADAIVKMIQAIQQDLPLPRKTCRKLGTLSSCQIPG